MLVSAELDEILSLSDRVIVLYEGKIVGEVDPGSVSEEEIGLMMTGGSARAEERGSGGAAEHRSGGAEEKGGGGEGENKV